MNSTKNLTLKNMRKMGGVNGIAKWLLMALVIASIAGRTKYIKDVGLVLEVGG